MKVIEKIIEYNPEAIVLSDLDDAIIGISQCGKVIYSLKKIKELLIQQDINEEDALEYIDFNIINAYLGEFTPIYIYEL